MLRLLSYLRSFCAALFYPLFVLGMSVLEIVLNLLLNNRRVDDFMVRTWGKLSCWLFGVKPVVYGLDKFPQGGCILLFNHTSFFDIFAMAATLPGIRFGAKEELFRIPFFGAVMRRVGMLEIARERREEVFRVYEEAQKRFALGEKFALAPEGTRQPTEQLGNFKSGPFMFAINGQAPLVPIVIKGAARILPKHGVLPNWGVWSSQVDVVVLSGISTVGATREDKARLMEIARAAMAQELGQ